MPLRNLNVFSICLFLFSYDVVLGHGGATIKKGPKKGCHKDSQTNILHCHGRASKKGRSKAYSRSLYPHWVDKDGDCQNERQELLIGRSLVPVIMKEVRQGKKRCTVSSGTWRDFYYEELLTDATNVEVDHVVALKHAHVMGAKNWSRSRRIDFANDPDNLVLTNKKYNRIKGAKTPLEWLPSDKIYACKFFQKWFLVKEKYELKISKRERREFERMKCPSAT